jgi:mono/diheme cytochrome c family protein
MPSLTFRFAALIPLAVACAAPPPASVEFNRDIRPIFSDRCYTCHGPDQANRKSKLRLDTEDGAKADLGGRFGIVPGEPSKSEVIRRVTAPDNRRMPPAWAGLPRLTDRQIDLLTRWIAQGAVWQKHWSFIPPVRPELPEVSDPHWVRNPIDSFVLARLDREGLRPSPEADRRTLIRRVSLDLTGLPPTPQDVAAFVADRSSNAYEKVVDRLLASPRYGERMAIRWLDGARYADTNGYQTDGERSMWRWRDWVIDAFNRNVPFDQFTVDQIAGDMLPHATSAQILATGFNRNHRGNGEGGIIPEEYAAEYVVDRVETTSAVWLGVTLGCARCHNHKYDPFTQKEFYQVFAYFNNVPERGKAFKYGNSPPVMEAPTAEQEARLQALDKNLSAAERRLAELEPAIAKAQAEWQRTLAKSPVKDWASPRGLAVHLPFDGDLHGEIHHDPPRSEKYLYLMENGPAVVQAPAPQVIEPVWKEGAPEYHAGHLGQAAVFDGKRYVEVGNVANFGFYDRFTLAAWIYPTSGTGAIITRALDEKEGQGLGLYLKDGHLQANLVQRWLDDGARVESKSAVEVNRWSHVILTYDGSRMADGIRIYLNGRPLELTVHLDDLNQSFAAKEPLRIGAGLGLANRFHGLIDEVRIYRVALGPEEAAVLAVPDSINEIAREPSSGSPAAKLRWCFLDRYAPPAMRDAWKQILDLRDQREGLHAGFPTVMVMRENAFPRETHILLRGAYDRPGEKVSPGLPAVLPPLPAGAPNNRLGFAEWLVDPANPLTARVVMNRFWQMYFGTGIVKTVEDFGSQGEWPSHPELLDWLATEFIRTGWDVKAMQKLMVMSATYRQSSKITPELLQRDPENRLLARGPRFRLPAEMLRDQALAVSGLLVEKIGGPSVKPYQPPGLWKELTGGDDYIPDKGEGLHRRSLYTYWKRTAPPPMMMNFDAAGRETCVVRASRTNTPLQALNLMNDPEFLEAARALAGRMLREGGATEAERIAYGFRLATARPPKREESEILLSSYRYYLGAYRNDAAQAYATVASLILNLDATVTKE